MTKPSTCTSGSPLVVMGALGSLGFAVAVAALIAALGFPPYLDFSIEWSTVVVAGALALLTLVVVGLLPAWKVAQQHLIDAIKDGGQNLSRTLDRTMMRRVTMTRRPVCGP